MKQMPARRGAPPGLRLPGPLALLLSPHRPKGMAEPVGSVLVARASPAGLRACSEVHHLLRDRPLARALDPRWVTAPLHCKQHPVRRKLQF